jgi:hypothetical protein
VSLQLTPNFLEIAYGTSASALIQFGRNFRDGGVWRLIAGHILSPGAAAAPQRPASAAKHYIMR